MSAERENDHRAATQIDHLVGDPGFSEPGRTEGMLAVGDRAEIRRLCRSEGMPIQVISRVMGVSRNTVKRALASDRPPKYERPTKGSVVDAVEPQIRELLKVYPTMLSTVIAERIGWTRSVRVLSGRVARVAAGVSAAGPSVADHLCCRGVR